jgi:hypothetical protein
MAGTGHPHHTGKRRAFGLLLAALAGCASLLVPARPSAAVGRVSSSSGARAVVVVDDGSQRVVVDTPVDSQTDGLDLLRRAGFELIVTSFGSYGGAVCSIGKSATMDPVGCPPSGCLTCRAPEYWNYFRAPAGSTKFTSSLVGASRVEVHDCDIDAWVWGSHPAPPPLPARPAACSSPPTQPRPTTATTSRSPAVTSPDPAVGLTGAATPLPASEARRLGSQGGIVGSTTTTPASSAATKRDPTRGAPTSSVLRRAPGSGEAAAAPMATDAHHAGGPSAAATGAALVLIAFVIGWGVVLRRRRAA